MTNADYVANLAQIQNTMGMVSDAYDAGYNVYKMLDWSDPDTTFNMIQILSASMVGTWLVLYLVPWNYLLLFGGVGIFIANTAVFKAASLTLTPVLMTQVQKSVEKARAALKKARDNGDAVTPVIIFENQRWWAGTGFVPFLLAQERAPWTDESGLVALAPKDLYELPDEKSDDGIPRKWEWADEDWTIDFTWAPALDDAGWEYCNNSWEERKGYRAMGSFTRHRKWIRNMKLVSV